MARTEFALAAKLRPRKVSDFPSPEHLRRDLIESINQYRREQASADRRLSRRHFQAVGLQLLADWLGLARRQGSRTGVLRHLLRKDRITRRFPGVRVSVLLRSCWRRMSSINCVREQPS